MTKKSHALRGQLAEAALRLAARVPWDKITLEAIARSAKIPKTKVQTICRQKLDLLSLIVDYVDEQAMSSIDHHSKMTPRERLFEVFMARFDILQKHRQAFRSIVLHVRRDPAAFNLILREERRHISSIIRILGPDQGLVDHIIRSLGATFIYAFSFWVWRKDETIDMSKTMASLDRALVWAEKISGFFPLSN